MGASSWMPIFSARKHELGGKNPSWYYLRSPMQQSQMKGPYAFVQQNDIVAGELTTTYYKKTNQAHG